MSLVEFQKAVLRHSFTYDGLADSEKVAALMESIQQIGQQEPVLLKSRCKRFQVLPGNSFLRALP